MDTEKVEQGPAPSIEDRAAALFADEPVAPQPEEAAAPETQDAPAPEEFFELEVDGEKFSLPKKLEKAVLQERDYTQKSQSLADQRRQFELLHEQARISNFRQEFSTEVGPELQKLQAYDAVLKQPVDWASMTTDEAFRAKIQRDQWKDERDAIARTLQDKHQQFEKKVQDALKDLKTKASEVISKRIPNWSDDTQKAIREHAISEGYTASELDSIVDPRHTLTLWKAQQFDQLKAKAAKTVADVKTVKTTPSNPMPQQVKDKLNFRKQIAKSTPGSQEHRKLVEARAAKIFM